MGHNDEKDLAELAREIAEKNHEVELFGWKTEKHVPINLVGESETEQTILEQSREELHSSTNQAKAEDELSQDEVVEMEESKSLLKNMIVTTVLLIVLFIGILIIVVTISQSRYFAQKSKEIIGIPNGSDSVQSETQSKVLRDKLVKGPEELYENLSKQLGIEINIQWTDRQQKLSAAGLDEILSPGRIARDIKLNDSKLIINKVREINGKFAANIDSVFTKYSKELEKIEATDEQKKSMLEELNAKKAKADAVASKMSADAEKYYTKIEEMINILVENKGKWSADENEIYFKDQTVKSRFEKCGNEIIEMTSQK